ncbi:hypothetical protein RQP46_002695 [Phenoliferia psychrophenolica]
MVLQARSIVYDDSSIEHYPNPAPLDMGSAAGFVLFGSSAITTGATGSYGGDVGISKTGVAAITITPGLQNTGTPNKYTDPPQVSGFVYGPAADGTGTDFTMSTLSTGGPGCAGVYAARPVRRHLQQQLDGRTVYPLSDHHSILHVRLDIRLNVRLDHRCVFFFNIRLELEQRPELSVFAIHCAIARDVVKQCFIVFSLIGADPCLDLLQQRLGVFHGVGFYIKLCDANRQQFVVCDFRLEFQLRSVDGQQQLVFTALQLSLRFIVVIVVIDVEFYIGFNIKLWGIHGHQQLVVAVPKSDFLQL